MKKSLNKQQGKKVFVGLSGGVDSAVSAAILKKQGFDVTGVFIKVWHPDFLPCNWREERRDAMRVAAKLDIPFLFLDFENEYKKGVVDNMISEYKEGRTPNPDVLCNKVVKFGSFWQKAKELGADYIATGHYAKVIEKEGKYFLGEGADKNKDQSYFLWTIKSEDLSHILFPVGNLEKKEVRKIADSLDLPVSEKKDSQGICFIGDINLEDFLSHFIESTPGKVLDIEGNVIGDHNGAVFYTIGERHGFEVTKKTPHSGAFYVVKKDLINNSLTVTDNLEVRNKLSPSKILIDEINWISPPSKDKIFARIRYRQEKTPILISGMEEKSIEVDFLDNQLGISLGQSIVFYENNICLGGGVMKKVIS